MKHVVIAKIQNILKMLSLYKISNELQHLESNHCLSVKLYCFYELYEEMLKLYHKVLWAFFECLNKCGGLRQSLRISSSVCMCGLPPPSPPWVLSHHHDLCMTLAEAGFPYWCLLRQHCHSSPWWRLCWWDWRWALKCFHFQLEFDLLSHECLSLCHHAPLIWEGCSGTELGRKIKKIYIIINYKISWIIF